MNEVTIGELRKHAGRVVDRVAAGEQFVVTRDGQPVARLVSVKPGPLSSHVLTQRWSTLPAMDSDLLRSNVEVWIDQSL